MRSSVCSGTRAGLALPVAMDRSIPEDASGFSRLDAYPECWTSADAVDRSGGTPDHGSRFCARRCVLCIVDAVIHCDDLPVRQLHGARISAVAVVSVIYEHN